MNTKGFSHPLILIIGVIVMIGFIGFVYFQNFKNIRNIQNYEDCVKAGYPALLSSPGQCNTPDGQHFTQSLSQKDQEILNADVKNLESQRTTNEQNNQNWKTFISETEGFTIRYPNNWIVEDTSSGNCAHTSGTSTSLGYCRDRFDFISSDGLVVRYVIHKDENNDKIGCGVQSPCDIQNVKEIEKLNVNSLGTVLLIKQNKEVNLHKPIDSGTMPIVGANQHSDYMIDFTLPSKTGGRFAIFVATPNPETKFDKLTSEQFYNAESVKQAIQILKSISY